MIEKKLVVFYKIKTVNEYGRHHTSRNSIDKYNIIYNNTHFIMIAVFLQTDKKIWYI